MCCCPLVSHKKIETRKEGVNVKYPNNLTTTPKFLNSRLNSRFKDLIMAAYSICIPRVFANIRWKRVKAVFDQLDLGVIDRIDMVQRTDDEGSNFQRCFVHFKTWNDSENARAVREQLDAENGMIKIVYSEPWFWKCYKSRVARPEQPPKSKQTRSPTIELEGGKIIRAAQRAGSRKVQGRRGASYRKSRSENERTASPPTSSAADEFLSKLSDSAVVEDYQPHEISLPDDNEPSSVVEE